MLETYNNISKQLRLLELSHGQRRILHIPPLWSTSNAQRPYLGTLVEVVEARMEERETEAPVHELWNLPKSSNPVDSRGGVWSWTKRYSSGLSASNF